MVVRTHSNEALEEGLRNTDSRVQELMNSNHQLQKYNEEMGDKFGHLQSTIELMVAAFKRNLKGRGVASSEILVKPLVDLSK